MPREKGRSPRTTRSYEDLTQQAREFIDRHYNEPGVSLDDFCRQTYYSSRSVQRALEHCGVTWREMLTERRMSAVINLLMTTEKSVATIALLAGYQTDHGMVPIFKREFGCHPATYRRLNAHA